MNEQIKEMMKDLCNIPSICNVETYTDCKAKDGSCPKCRNIARDLYNAGYRKQSEGKNIAMYPKSAFECSECHWEDWDMQTADSAYNFCPNCGAKMKG